MQKLKNWYYSLYKFRMEYTIDKAAMVARVKTNKPDNYIFGDERIALTTLTNHFTVAGYCVLVED